MAMGAVALAAGCGGAVQGTAVQSSPPASPVPTSTTTAPPAFSPSPTPSQITSGPVPTRAAAVARRYWSLLDQGRIADVKRLLAPDSPINGPSTVWSKGHYRLLSVSDRLTSTPPDLATIEFKVMVDVTPGKISTVSAGRDPFWMSMVETTDGDWLVYEAGTGP